LLELLIQIDQEIVGLAPRAVDLADVFGEGRAVHHRRDMQERHEVLEHVRRVAERKELRVRLQEEVERVDHRHLGGEVDLDGQLVGRLIEDQSREEVAVRVLLPVEEVLGRANLQRVAEHGRAAVGRGPQADDVRVEGDRRVVLVLGLVMERNADGHWGRLGG
jgi:hypothetical protein